MHISVLVDQAIAAMALGANDNVIDATIGQGGHSKIILAATAPKGFLLGLDRDTQQIERAKENLSQFGSRARFINDSFGNLKEVLNAHPEYNVYQWKAVLYDLGWSQVQVEESKRGFSFAADEPLDMRYDTRQKQTAGRIIATYTQERLKQLLFTYGEERFAPYIARNIIEERAKHPITTTFHLVEIIKKATPLWYHHRRLHPATRTFQALRIEVNNEYQEIKDGLRAGLDALVSGGRLVVISFHSGEDRIVKHTFLQFQKDEEGNIITKKPLGAQESELALNPRARSAKMRVFQKL